jgi:phage terminase large subunit GpA-like protein
VSLSTWKADLSRRLWLGRGDVEDYPAGWVHLPRGIEVEWVKQFVAEQLRTVKDRRGFARQEWAKLRERNEALDCAVLARGALAARRGSLRRALLGAAAGGGGECAACCPACTIVAARAGPISPQPATAPNLLRSRGGLAPRSGWLR